jgi:hypothetical protein
MGFIGNDRSGWWLAGLCLAAGSWLACDQRQRGDGPIGKQVGAQTYLSSKVPVVDIDLERPASITGGATVNRKCDQTLTYDGATHTLPLEGSACDAEFTGDKPYVSSSISYKKDPSSTGVKSLELTLRERLGRKNGVLCAGGTGCTVPPAPDRAGLVANAEGDEALYGVGFNFDNPKYLGFALLVHGSSSLPLQSPVDIMRVQQCGSGTNATTCKDALVATLYSPGGSNATTPLSLKFVATDDRGAHPISTYTTSISVNQWRRFAFYLQPRSNANTGSVASGVFPKGVVTIWVDDPVAGTMRQLADWHQQWGFNPSTSPNAAVADSWRLEVGLTRTGAGIINQKIYAFFDNVRVAPSFTQADPGQAYPWL